MTRVVSLFLGCFFSAAAFAQTIQGRVTDAKTGAALPFVNIGVMGKALGTVTTEQGQYKLGYPASLRDDTVRISSLGYQPLRLPLSQLAAQPDLALSPTLVALQEVQVQAKNMSSRSRTLGFTGNSETSTLTINSKDLGAEIGAIIYLKHKPSKLVNVNFNVAYNHAGQLTFRLNLYRLNAAGQPTEAKLLRREVIVHTAGAKGSITLDLTADKLVLDEDFFLALEWIGGANAAQVHEGLAFSAGVGYANNDIYTRATSQAAWERVSAGAVLAGMQPKLGFFVTVQD